MNPFPKHNIDMSVVSHGAWCFPQMHPSDSTIGCICSHLMPLLLRVLLSGEVIPEITLPKLPSHSPTQFIDSKKSAALPFWESESSAGGCLCLWTTSVKNLLQFNERKGWKERESGGCLSLGFQDLVGILHSCEEQEHTEVKKPQEEEEAHGNWVGVSCVTGTVYHWWKGSFCLKTDAPAW